MPHDHDHTHCHDESHAHDHDHDHESETGPADNLYPYIDLQNVAALNLTDDSAGKAVIKPWDRRLDEIIVRNFCLTLTVPVGLQLSVCRK